MRRLGIVVEGDGDQGAVPVLVRDHFYRRGIFDIEVGRPVNTKGRGKLLRAGELERFVRLASFPPGTCGVLLICDADDDAVCELGPVLTHRCRAALPHMPSRACLANREFENWLLASAETIAPQHIAELEDYEAVSAVPRVTAWRQPAKYIKPIHQPALAAGLDPELVAQRCASFARFLRCLDELADVMRNHADQEPQP